MVLLLQYTGLNWLGCTVPYVILTRNKCNFEKRVPVPGTGNLSYILYRYLNISRTGM